MVLGIPSDGGELHIDAKRHFAEDSEKIVHHYCKGVRDGITECQLYESDREDARLLGVEVIVGPEIYNSFSDEEKRFWHYHKEEIEIVDAKLPDLSSEEAAKVIESILETYGKVYNLWDYNKGEFPQGNPGVVDIDSASYFVSGVDGSLVFGWIVLVVFLGIGFLIGWVIFRSGRKGKR